MKLSNTRSREPSRTVVMVFWISVTAAYDHGSSSTAPHLLTSTTMSNSAEPFAGIIIVFHVVFIRYAYVLRVFRRRNVGRLQVRRLRCFPIDYQFVRYFHHWSWKVVINWVAWTTSSTVLLAGDGATPSPMLIPSNKILYSISSTVITSSGPPPLHSSNNKMSYTVSSTDCISSGTPLLLFV